MLKFLILTNSIQESLPEKLIFAQLIKMFLTFYGTQRFSAVFTRACHWTLS
jgi:hypothetical protein